MNKDEMLNATKEFFIKIKSNAAKSFNNVAKIHGLYRDVIKERKRINKIKKELGEYVYENTKKNGSHLTFKGKDLQNKKLEKYINDIYIYEKGIITKKEKLMNL